MAEHVELVEHPGLLLGAFDEAFLELPEEVVVTTLRHHQKCLVLERARRRRWRRTSWPWSTAATTPRA